MNLEEAKKQFVKDYGVEAPNFEILLRYMQERAADQEAQEKPRREYDEHCERLWEQCALKSMTFTNAATAFSLADEFIKEYKKRRPLK